MNLLIPLKIIFSQTLTVRAQRVPNANGFVLLSKSFSQRGLVKFSLPIWFAQSSRLVLTKLPAGNEEKEEKEEVEEEEEEEEKEEVEKEEVEEEEEK